MVFVAVVLIESVWPAHRSCRCRSRSPWLRDRGFRPYPPENFPEGSPRQPSCACPPAGLARPQSPRLSGVKKLEVESLVPPEYVPHGLGAAPGRAAHSSRRTGTKSGSSAYTARAGSYYFRSKFRARYCCTACRRTGRTRPTAGDKNPHRAGFGRCM